MANDKLIPAIPPEDYKGSVGKWMIGLQVNNGGNYQKRANSFICFNYKIRNNEKIHSNR